jgi:hypothetical protein
MLLPNPLAPSSPAVRHPYSQRGRLRCRPGRRTRPMASRRQKVAGERLLLRQVSGGLQILAPGRDETIPQPPDWQAGYLRAVRDALGGMRPRRPPADPGERMRARRPPDLCGLPRRRRAVARTTAQRGAAGAMTARGAGSSSAPQRPGSARPDRALPRCWGCSARSIATDPGRWPARSQPRS